MRSYIETFMVLETKLCKFQRNVTVEASNLHLVKVKVRQNEIGWACGAYG